MDERTTILGDYPDEPVTCVDEKENVNMANVNESVRELEAEIESYRETIASAEAALDSAEKELNEVLSELS